MSPNNINRSRRRFCGIVAGTAAVLNIPAGARVDKPAQTKFTLENLHTQILRRVNELASKKNVTLTILQPKGSLGNVKPVGDAFQQATGVNINYMEGSLDEINSAIMADTLAQNSSFDIALPATFGLPDLVEVDAIRNLDDFAEKYQPEDFYDGVLYSTGDYFKGSLYGYQTDGDAYVMFYNKAWMEDPSEQQRFKAIYGYDLKVPQTWEQLDQMIEYFHRPEQNKFGGTLFRTKDYMAWEWWIRFHAKGYMPFDDNLNPQINNSAGIAALSELISLSKSLYPLADSNGLFENWEAFSMGNAFCNIGWGGTQKFLNSPKSRIRDNILFAPTPGGYKNGELLLTPYFNWGWNYTVSNFSKEPEIAYLFTLYACSPKMSTLAVRFPDGYFDPFRIEHYKDSNIQSTYSKSFLDTHLVSMKNSIPDLYLPGQGEYLDALKENIDLANQGFVTPERAMNTVAKIWRHINHRLGVSSQLEQWHYLKSRYPNNIKTRLS